MYGFSLQVILPSLEELNLCNLGNMKKLWADHNQGMYCCQNLTKVIVWRCDCLKYLFSYSMVNSLLQLQHLEISYCSPIRGGQKEKKDIFVSLNYTPCGSIGFQN